MTHFVIGDHANRDFFTHGKRIDFSDRLEIAALNGKKVTQFALFKDANCLRMPG